MMVLIEIDGDGDGDGDVFAEPLLLGRQIARTSNACLRTWELL